MSAPPNPREHFPLLRHFSLASLLLTLAATVALSVIYHEAATRSLIETGTRHNLELTRAFFSSLWPQLMPVVKRAPAMSAEQLRLHPDTALLQEAVRRHADGLSVLKIKVFDLHARTIFSTSPGDVGADASANAGFLAARRGEVASELTYQNTFSAFERVVERTNVLSTYIPIRSRTGEIQAVFELYDDVTPLVARISRTQIAVTVGAALVLTLLYAALFFVVRRADRILAGQQREIERHVAALESSEQRLARTQFAVDNASEMVVWLDRDGRFLYANEAALAAIGCSRDELGGLSILDVDATLDAAAWEARWTDLRRGDVRRDARYRSRSGAETPVDVTMTRVEFDGCEFACLYARDMSERQRMEQALRDSERRFRDVAEAAGEYIVEVDRAGCYTFLSGRVKEVLGYEPAELLGRTPAEFMPPGEAERVRAWFARNVPEGAPFRDLEHRMTHRGGCELWVLVNCVPILGADGRHTGYRGTVRDVTRRKVAEDALVQARDDAEAASRAKSQFLANMSHEFRTPMNAIVALTRLTLQEDGLGSEARENLESVADSARALLGTLTNVLEYVDLEAGRVQLNPVRFEPRQAFAATLAAFRRRATEKRLVLDVVYSERLPESLYADAGRLDQALSKLLDNALKFTATGSVRVLWYWSGSPTTQLRITVQDTGTGIPADHLGQLFERFHQVDPSITRRYGGIGLGLAICARLAGLMGGRAWAESTPGHGSAFHFEVPAEQADAD